MRLLGNLGTVRVGATAGIEFYWNRQWTVNYKAASCTLIKTVKLSNEDLSAFYIKGKCESGSLDLKMTQDGITKHFNISSGFNKAVDMTEFNAGLIKFVLTIKSARKIKVLVGWRR